jgi:hypothetical protein
MSFYDRVVTDFNNYPALVGKVVQLLAEGGYVCVLLGDGVDFRIVSAILESRSKSHFFGSLFHIPSSSSRLSGSLSRVSIARLTDDSGRNNRTESSTR